MARRGLDSHRALEVCVFGIGEGELAIILVFGFLLFGPDKLPQMGRTIGRAIRQFKETQEKMTAVVQSEIIDPVSEAAQAPLKRDEDDDDEDEDEETSEGTEPKHQETFAERRARLAAEKAAAAGVAAEGDDAEDEGADDEPDGDDESAAADDTEADVPAEPAPEPEPEVHTTADLYARRPRKHKAVVEELAAELAAEEAEEAAANDAAAADDAVKGGEE